MYITLRFTCLLLLLNSLTLRAQDQTWADDVACIMYSHCTSCHNPKGAAPFSLMNYDTAVLFSSSIQHAVEHNEMPPWPIDNKYRKMAHDRSLSDGERNAILNWISGGAKKGNMANAPTPPVYSYSEVITNPDLKLQIPTYTVPTITEDLYRCFVLPTGMSAEKFITGIEIIPGNKSIVHHAQVFYDTTGTSTVMDANDPGPGYTSPGGIGTNSAVLLGTWVPGSSPIFVPSGMGKRLPLSAKIVVQIHYPHYSSSETDSTKINFLFTSSKVRNIFDAPVLNHNSSMIDGPLFIPKNTVKTFHQQFLVPLVGTILNIGPHGHLLCKSMKAYGVTLAGDTIPLVNIPEWDFHWQGTYDFPQPIKIPFGTTLYGEATYDNTSNNPENPHNPPQDVHLGENTTDEMMLFYFSYLPYQNGDEHIVIDTSSHKAHHNNCTAAHVSIDEPAATGFNLYPNPANSVLFIQADKGSDFECYIYNQLGEVVWMDHNKTSIDIADFASGIYCVRFIQEGKIFSKMLVKE